MHEMWVSEHLPEGQLGQAFTMIALPPTITPGWAGMPKPTQPKKHATQVCSFAGAVRAQSRNQGSLAL